MPHIDSTRYGDITIDRARYRQVLIVGGRVMERDYDRLTSTYGTSHRIGPWEVAELDKGSPEVVVVGKGQSGMLRVEKTFVDHFREKGVEVIAVETPEAVRLFNEKMAEGKRVNGLFHTTC